MRAMRSERPRELASPVVPRTPRPSAPCSRSQRAWVAMRSRSTERSGLHGGEDGDVHAAVESILHQIVHLFFLVLVLLVLAGHAAGPVHDVVVEVGPASRSSMARPRTEAPAVWTVAGSFGAERVPREEVAAFVEQAVGAAEGGSQSISRTIAGGEGDAVGDVGAPGRVVAALAGAEPSSRRQATLVKAEFFGVVVAEFVQAAAAAAVADVIPIRRGTSRRAIWFARRAGASRRTGGAMRVYYRRSGRSGF